MLRAVLAALLVANAGYFAWSQGHLSGLGLVPAVQEEPERLAGQIRPDDLQLHNGPRASLPLAVADGPPAGAQTAPETPMPTAEAAPEPTGCWQAAGFTPDQVVSLRSALARLEGASGNWQLTEKRINGRWLVFMGAYNPEQMARKKSELEALKIDFREVNLPAQGNGLVLGTFSSEADVRQALQDVARKGVRTARAVQERPESSTTQLQLPAITEAQRAAVAAVVGRPLQRCN